LKQWLPVDEGSGKVVTEIMATTPKAVADDTQTIIDGWGELAPAATFAGMTLAQFKAAVQPSFDARAQIVKLETDLKAAQDARDQADVTTSDKNDKVVKAVVADVNYGDDSALYESMGYVRKSARASGLTRKSKAAAANAVKK
jgi:hypothetical protein